MKKLVLILVALIIVGCTEGRLETLVYERIFLSQTPALDSSSYHFLSVRAFGERTIALYKATESSPPYFEQLGYGVFTKGVTGWKMDMSGTSLRDVTTLAGDLVDYTYFAMDPAAISDIDYRVVVGEIFSSDVVAVEILLANNTILRDDGQGGVFAFLFPEAYPASELRILGQDDVVLQTIYPLES